MVSLRGLALRDYICCVIEPTGHNNMCCVTDLPSRKHIDSSTPTALWAATPSYWGIRDVIVGRRTVSLIADHIYSQVVALQQSPNVCACDLLPGLY